MEEIDEGRGLAAAESGGAEHRRRRSSATLNNSNNGEGLTATGERKQPGVCDAAVVRDAYVLRFHAINHAKKTKLWQAFPGATRASVKRRVVRHAKTFRKFRQAPVRSP